MRFVVMGNVFPTEVRIHRKYDLKGSTHGRTAGARKLTDPETILKVSIFSCEGAFCHLSYQECCCYPCRHCEVSCAQHYLKGCGPEQLARSAWVA